MKNVWSDANEFHLAKERDPQAGLHQLGTHIAWTATTDHATTMTIHMAPLCCRTLVMIALTDELVSFLLELHSKADAIWA